MCCGRRDDAGQIQLDISPRPVPQSAYRSISKLATVRSAVHRAAIVSSAYATWLEHLHALKPDRLLD